MPPVTDVRCWLSISCIGSNATEVSPVVSATNTSKARGGQGQNLALDIARDLIAWMADCGGSLAARPPTHYDLLGGLTSNVGGCDRSFSVDFSIDSLFDSLGAEKPL